MKVNCIAFDRAGKRVQQLVEADTVAEAIEQLRGKGYFVTETHEQGASGGTAAGAAAGGGALALVSRRGGSLKDLTSFFRQLSILVSTGTPVVEALGSLERQALPGSGWQKTLADIKVRVEQGASLSDAMEHHGRVFDAVCRSLIAAGESGGQLPSMLQRLSALTRQKQHTRSMIVGAMVYPCVLIVVSVSVLITMIVFVMPRFQGLFETLGADLPASTKVLMGAGAFMRQWWWALLVGAGVGGFFIKMWLASADGRRWWHRAVIRLPILGVMTRSFATARVCRVLGVLLEGRVPLLDALALTRESVPNVHYQDMIEESEAEVARGENISSIFASSGLVQRSICEALRSGEKSGQMGPVLSGLADYLDEDNEVTLKSLTSILEPLILVGLGLVVGAVALSMFMPLFDLAAASSGGGGGAP